MAAGAGVNDFECGRSIQQTPDGGYRLKGVMILPITVMQVQPNVDMMYESSNWKQNLRRNRAVTKLNRIIECKKKKKNLCQRY